jgi:hypothetical protein
MGIVMSQRIESFKNLIVYKKAFKLQQEIFEITKTYPREEQYSLTDQIRRASRSVVLIYLRHGRSDGILHISRAN